MLRVACVSLLQLELGVKEAKEEEEVDDILEILKVEGRLEVLWDSIWLKALVTKVQSLRHETLGQLERRRWESVWTSKLDKLDILEILGG